MKAWAWMLAIVPLLSPETPRPSPRASACTVAIAIDVRAPIAWGRTEWHLFTREVERTWASYGVTFCWLDKPAFDKASAGAPNSCEGLEVRVRVIISDDLPSLDTADAKPSLGRIHFRDGEPVGAIELSLVAARYLSAQARLGDRPMAELPRAIAAGVLPRVLGRGLAHEIGHLLLRSPAHSATGLMASGFTPEDVVWGDASRFTLSKASALAVSSECSGRRMAAR
jgi:hypothetical protein